MFTFECNTHERDCLVMFLGQYDELSQKRFINSVQKAYEGHLTPELVFFVYPGYLEEEVSSLLEDDNVVVDMTRQKSSSVICINFNENGIFVVSKSILGSNQQEFVPDLTDLRPDIIKAGYEKLITGRVKDVLAKSPSGTIFSKPSGETLEEFIYASQLARCNFENQFIAMSLLAHAPSLEKIDAIYIDTSSISPIVEAILHYVSRFRGEKCKHITYKSFSSYSGLEENVKPDNVDGTWLIISASASLSMGKRLVKDWNISPEQVVTILSYQPLLKMKGDDKDKNIGNDVVFCVADYSKRDKKSFSPTKVQVQGESFSVEVSTPNKAALLKKFKPGYIDKAIYPFHNSEVFSVNRNGHALFVDYLELRKGCLDKNDELLTGSDLYVWIKKIVEWKIPSNIKAIIASLEDDSAALVKDFRCVFSDCGFDVSSIVDIEIDDQLAMEGIGNDSVLILSPAVSTGHVFVDVNRALRLSSHNGMRIFATPFVVSPSQDQFKTVETSLTQGTMGFKYSYLQFQKIYLSSKNLSSWSKELEVVTALINGCDNEAADFWVARKELLLKEGEGLGNAIGVHCSEAGGIFELVPDFVFWPSGYVPEEVNLPSVYATVGAILQNLRDNEIGDSQLSANIYQHSVLDPENFVRFNDSILQSCLWRCALPGELDYRRSDPLSSDMQRILTKIIKSSGSQRGVTSLDLLIGLATRWIKISSSEMEKVILCAEEYLTMPHAELLTSYLRKEFIK